MSPSRYLIIEFDDEATASLLRERIDKATRSGKNYRIVGLFAKPTEYCKCDPRQHVTHDRSHSAKTKRGKKFGWWVCTECRRPLSNIGALNNLLKPRDIINPPKWMSRHWKGAADFEAQHHIISLSAQALGPQGVEFWNER